MTAKKPELPKDLNKDYVASRARLNELRKGRPIGEIPLQDEYWEAKKKHEAAYGKKD